MVLVIAPSANEVTLTSTVHTALGARLAPESDTERALAVAVTTPPGQVVLAAGLGASTMPFNAAPEAPPAVK